ncbi:MAG: hypothetical protein JST15_13560 [Bacteroidetes bacterium]|nr:hypothetical protein [Bacteroidota bacterium]
MLKTFNNKWTHRDAGLVLPPPPDNFMHNSGIYYLSVALDEKVGEEVVLIIYDDSDFNNKLVNVKPFRFVMSSIAVNTNYGPVGVFIFSVENPLDKNIPFALYDKPVNIANYNMIKPWLELANQTHIHLLLVNKKYDVVGFYEFENTYNFEEAIDVFMQLKPENVVDFEKATEEYFRDFSLEYLTELIKNRY